MPQKNRSRKLARVALCATFGIFLVVASGVAAAYAEDDEDDLLPDAKLFRSIMRGIGLRNGQEAGIEYKGERPPLVVPPNRNLPPPVTTGSITASNPAWPADPDLKKRKVQPSVKEVRKLTNEQAWEESSRALTPQELTAGKTDKPSERTGRGPDYSPELTPSELGYTNRLWSSFKSLGSTFSKDKEPETARFVREPSRAALTDPPSGYRTPSPAQPYGVNTRASLPKAENGDHQTGDFGKN
jgi:hypothetical protein